MNSNVYSQLDSRWASMPYPTRRSSFGGNGCGCCACLHVIIELDKYKNWTPANLSPWMVDQGFAYENQGTLWSGIPKTLEHFGFKAINHATMTDIFDTLDKRKSEGKACLGVILFGSGSRGGIIWTSGGHYVAFVDYKKDSNGNHYFYTKDSGGRRHTGWYCYETQMKGLIPQIWSALKPNETPSPTPTPTPDDGYYAGEYPNPSKYLEKGDRGTEVGKLQDYLDWYTDGKFYEECGGRDNIFGANTDKYVKQMQTDFFGASEADGLVGQKTIAKMKAYNKKDPKPTPTPTPSGKHYGGEYPNPKKYLEYGDKGTEVGKLQDYLNWYTDGEFYKNCGGRDNIYGKNTLKYVNKMLTDFFGASEADGQVGHKTIAKMKAYVKPDSPTPTPTPTPEPSEFTSVIDVSAFQDSINWTKVKLMGVDGVMIRCGYRGYETAKLNEDSMFLNHIQGASKAGLKVGVYFFTEAINYAEGKEEAEYTLSLIKKAGVKLYYPIAVDTEAQSASTERAKNLSKAQRTQAIKGFCDTIEAHGGKAMIYASTSWFYNKLDMSQLPFYVWCAQYYSECQYKGKYVMWQFTSEGSVDGVDGVVDMNKCYITSASPMPDSQPTPSKKSYTGPYPTNEGILDASYKGIHNRMCTWCYNTYKSGKYHYVHFTDDAYTHQCPICTKRTYDLGWNCIGYATASLRHGGEVNCTCNCMTIYNGLGDRFINMSDAEVLSAVQNRFGVQALKIIRNNNKHIPESMLEKGDLLMYYTGDAYAHMAVYIGNGKISDCTSGAGVRYGVSYSMMKCLFAIRYTGARSYLEKGDEGKAVADLQNYLNWYTDGTFFKECGGADGIFGENTHRYTVKMQSDFFGTKEADGLVGQKTIAKMKEYSDSFK